MLGPSDLILLLLAFICTALDGKGGIVLSPMLEQSKTPMTFSLHCRIRGVAAKTKFYIMACIGTRQIIRCQAKSRKYLGLFEVHSPSHLSANQDTASNEGGEGGRWGCRNIEDIIYFDKV